MLKWLYHKTMPDMGQITIMKVPINTRYNLMPRDTQNASDSSNMRGKEKKLPLLNYNISINN